MKRFRFPLDAALLLRRRRVEVEESQYRQIANALGAVAAAARQLASEVQAAEEDVVGISVNTATQLQSLDRFRSAAARRLREFEAKSVAIRRDLARQQQRLVDARRDEELLLKLRAKARAQWELDADKELQDIADEAYLSQWARLR